MKERLTIYFDSNCGICLKVAALFEMINSKDIVISYLTDINDNHIDKEKARLFIASKSQYTIFYGYDTYIEAVSRIPLISFLSVIMKSRFIDNMGRKIYLKIAMFRTCVIQN